MKNYQEAVKVLQKYVDDQKIAGACLIVTEDGKTALNESVGWQDVEKQYPVSENTIFRLASMTKPITTIAAMILYDEGKIRLEDTIGQYLPEYKGTDKENIQIVHLLNHSCGLGMVMHPGMIQAIMLSDVQHDKLQDRVARWKELTPDFPAGTATGYSPNVGFEILGRIIEVVSGLPLDEFFRTRIFEPLQIADICFILNEEQASRRSIIFHDEAAPAPPIPSDFGDMESYVDAAIAGYFSGGAGLWGTAASYNRLVRMLENGGELDGVRILKGETVQKIHTPSNDLYARPGVKWGLGVQVFGKQEETGFYVHEGSYSWSGAYGTHFFIDPQAKRSFVLMTSSDGLGGSESYVSRAVEKAIFEAE